MTELVDSHAHLLPRYFGDDLAPALARARAAGVALIIAVGTTLEDSREALALALSEPDVLATAGVHPHEASSLDEVALAALAALLGEPKVVAVGECGLDYHYDHSPRDVQREALRQQVRLARTVRKPLVIHNRESDSDLVAILREEQAGDVGGVIHCFTAAPEVGEQLLDLGFHLGFGGVVTFKTAEIVRRSVALCPLDRLLLETDCPYLTPVPWRGQRNEPARLTAVLDRVAEVRGVPPDLIAAATTANARRLFGAKGA